MEMTKGLEQMQTQRTKYIYDLIEYLLCTFWTVHGKITWAYAIECQV